MTVRLLRAVFLCLYGCDGRKIGMGTLHIPLMFL